MSTRTRRYLIVNHRRLILVNEVGEEIARELPGGGLREGLRGGKQAVSLPPTWAHFRCKIEMQIEVDSEHAKDMFQV